MNLGVALRSEVFEPAIIKELVSSLDESKFSSVWFPDVAGFDSLELAALTLGASSRVKAATGVLRFHEHEPNHFAKRVRTVQAASGGRLIVGVGSGAMRGKAAIEGVEVWVGSLRKLLGEETKIYVAALRKGMFSAASTFADGVLLNFCSPMHVSRLVESLKPKREGFTVGCYIKVFYAQKEFIAKKMLVDEFVKYDSYPHYHELFQDLGVAETIARLKSSANPEPTLIEELSSIALPNPTWEEVRKLVEDFRKAGVDLPIVYPYVHGDGKYKAEVLLGISESLS